MHRDVTLSFRDTTGPPSGLKEVQDALEKAQLRERAIEALMRAERWSEEPGPPPRLFRAGEAGEEGQGEEDDDDDDDEGWFQPPSPPEGEWEEDEQEEGDDDAGWVPSPSPMVEEGEQEEEEGWMRTPSPATRGGITGEDDRAHRFGGLDPDTIYYCPRPPPPPEESGEEGDAAGGLDPDTIYYLQ